MTVIILLILSTLTVWGQITPSTPAPGGTTVTYSVNNGIVYIRPNWVVVNGSVQSTSFSGTTYSATVLWANTCTGLTGQLNFRNATTLVSYAEITVTAPTAAVTSASRCGSGPVTLTATPSPTGGTVRWYNAATNGTLLATGNSFTMPSLSASTTYYAACYLSATNCEGPRTAATATINALPSDPLVGPGGVAALSCGTKTFSLLAKFPEANTTFVWYTAAAGGSPFATGTPVSQTVSATTTFYVARRSDLTLCESNRMPVTITIENMPSNFTVTGSGNFCSTATVGLSGSQGGYAYQLQLNNIDVGTPITGNNAALSWGSLTGSGNYTVVAKSPQGTCTQAMGSTATLTVNPTTVGGTAAGSTTVCAPAKGMVTLGGHTGSVVRWEQNTGSGWTNIAQATAALNYTNLTTTTQYRAAVQSGNCALAYSSATTVTAYASPTITTTGNSIVYGNPTPQLSTATPSVSYQWTRNGADIAGAITQNYTVPNFGSYAVRTQPLPGFYCTSLTVTMGGIATAQSQPVNFVSTTAVLKEGITDPAQLFNLQPHEVKQAVQYQDGLGRTYQTVAVAQAAGTGRGDLVDHTAWGRNGYIDSTFLPYATTVPDGRMRPNALRANNNYTQGEQYQFYQNTAQKTATSQHPFAKTIYRGAPGVRVIEQGAPGADWQPGSNHTVRSALTLNTDSYPVKYWKPDGTTPGNYPVRTVSVAIATDENGNQVRTYTDSRGLTVLKQVQEGATNWLETYFIYDDLGRLKYQVPPKAVALLGSGTDVKVANLAELIYTYNYDSLNRVKEKKTPGAATQALVYDQLNRVVLLQDGNLKAQGKWMFVKYDQRNRPVYSGLYTSASTRHQLQQQVNGINYNLTQWYEVEQASTAHGYSNQTWPTANLAVLTVNYYDHYDFDRNGTPDYGYDNAHLGGTPAQASTDTWGKATGSKRAVMSTSAAVTPTYLVRVVFYDERGRTLQTQENNPLNLAVQDKATIKYDNARRVELTRTSHTAAGATTHIKQRNTYDHAGRVLKSFHKINALAEVQVAEYEYNPLGQLVDKKLHVAGGLPLQSIDYRYHIRGWLQSINNAQLNVNSANNDEATDYFGMELHYNTAEAGLGNTPYYNGNISAAKWKGLGTTGDIDQRSYKYTYDMSDRLKTATFAAHSGTGTNWAKEANTLDENMAYDANGNLATLLRNQNNRGLAGITVTSAPLTVDNLTYTYESGGTGTQNTNRLQKVEDAVAASVGTGDFKNRANNAAEYTYSADGSLAKDDNKGIQSISYNVLGKPLQVSYTNGRTVAYDYDAAGTKIRATTVANSVTTATDYLGGFVYTNNTMSFFGSPEGRVVKNGTNFEYQYTIADHQGNTRVVFSSVAPAAQVAPADFEAASNANFPASYGNRVNFNLFDHTDPGLDATDYAQKLTGATNAQVGVAKSYRVYAGDKVKIEAWAKYQNPSGTGSNLSGFVGALLAAFNLPAPAPGETGTPSAALNTWGGLVAGGSGGSGTVKAFVNIIVFDKNYKLLDMMWDPIDANANQMGATPVIAHDYMVREYTAKEESIVFAYVSNESPTLVDVYFDDVAMTYTPGNVVQYNEYYAYGLTSANSWTRENATGNNFLFNGGTELNTTTSVYDLHYRNYDPQLGRMNQVDPVAGKYASQTPYNYAFNAPTNFNDPLGDDPFFNRDAWRGNIRGGASPMYNRMPADGGSGGYGTGGSLSFAGWGAGYNSVEWNLALMGTNQFQNYYNVNLGTEAGREWLANNVSFTTYKGPFGRIDLTTGSPDIKVAQGGNSYIYFLDGNPYGVGNGLQGGYPIQNPFTLKYTGFAFANSPQEPHGSTDLANSVNKYGFIAGSFFGGVETGVEQSVRGLERVKVITGRAGNGAYLSEYRNAVTLANKGTYISASTSAQALKWGGRAFTGGVVAYNAIDLATNGATNRDLAKFGVQSTIAAIGFLGPIGFGVSIGLTLIEMNGGFDWLYNEFDNQTVHKVGN